MIRAVFLDSSPLGLVTQRSRKSPDVDACKAWIAALDQAGVTVYVPEVIDYEVRHELLRAQKTAGIQRLEQMKLMAHYLPLSTPAMLRAAELWAEARQRGIVNADAKALDVDVILCAQGLTVGLPVAECVIATENVALLSHYAPAALWQDIVP